MTGVDVVTLDRYRVYARPRAWSPFRRVRGEWVTTAKPVRVRRIRGKSMAVSLKPLHGYATLLTTSELEFVERVARRRGWILTKRHHQLRIPRYPHLDGDLDCNRDLLDRLNRVGAALGKTIFVRSGRRTVEEQQDLYDRYLAGRGPLAAVPNPNAPHVRGVAADCGIDGLDIGDYPGARGAMTAHGLCLPVPGEDWHVEAGSRWRG